ncbi:MAG: hypothetical protein ACT4QE_20595 [Anaerolineales bacterium]
MRGAVHPIEKDILRLNAADELIRLVNDPHFHRIAFVEGDTGQIDPDFYLPITRRVLLRRRAHFVQIDHLALLLVLLVVYSLSELALQFEA